MSADYSYSDYLEGLRSEDFEGIGKGKAISHHMRRNLQNMDDYPEFHYG